MSKNTVIAIVVVLVLLLGGYYFMMMDTPTDTTLTPTPIATVTPAPIDDTVVINLAPDETNIDVAQSGVMYLDETTEGLMVSLEMSGYETDVPQPAHIHAGACPDVGGIVYPLENVVDGESVTTLEGVTLSDVEDQMPLAVNVHKSAEEVSVYTACGDIEL